MNERMNENNINFGLILFYSVMLKASFNGVGSFIFYQNLKGMECPGWLKNEKKAVLL